jgi:hypothetical protein
MNGTMIVFCCRKGLVAQKAREALVERLSENWVLQVAE